MLKKLVAVTCCAILVLLLADAALACSCAPPPPPQEALKQSTAVFTGTVLAVTEAGTNRQVRLRVEKVWKGAKCGEVTIVTALDEAACGSNFQVGTSYLVYATREQGKLSTNLCTRTQPTAGASEDLAALGEPTTTCQ